MRIDLNRVDPANAAREEQPGKIHDSVKPASTPEVEDTASLSLDTLSLSALKAKALAQPEIRQDKVDALRQAIQSGDYQVDPEKIAQAIIDHYKR